MTLKAIIFDFNGVIINDEPIHLKMFQKVLKEENIRLTDKEYYKKYLAFDDQHCFRMILKTAGRPTSSSKIKDLIQKKAEYYEDYIEENLVLFPGARKWVSTLAKHFPLAIASAALGNEIRQILKRANLIKKFKVIVAAEDTKKSKPDPESYLQALKKLNRYRKILPEECLVIEDSIAGIEGAHRASMKCLALAHTYTKKQLQNADIVLKNFQEFGLEKIKNLF